MVRAEGMLLDSVHRGGRGAFGRALRALVSRAKERVWMSTPYLLPTASLRRALRRAAARQVDVRLLVPRVSDHPVVHYASQHYFARFLRWGIRLLQWEGGMMHTKAAAIDGEISALGSSNLDPLSLRRNDEVNVLFRSAELTARLEAILRDDFARAEEVLARTWRERSRLRRLLERACSFGSFLF
jgi:cardiolipin synthase